MADQLTLDEMRAIIERDLGGVHFFTTKGKDGGDPCASVSGNDQFAIGNIETYFFGKDGSVFCVGGTFYGYGKTNDETLSSLFGKLAKAQGHTVIKKRTYGEMGGWSELQYDPVQKAFITVELDETKKVFVPTRRP